MIGLSIRTPEQAAAAPLALIDYAGIGGVYSTVSKASGKSPIGVDGLSDVIKVLRGRVGNFPAWGIAGIMAGKKTSELIPLCHPLALTHIGVDFTPLPERNAFRIVASAKTTGKTGVEMEAMTAASVAALTVYDMVKALERGVHIEGIRLLLKSGGKSGEWRAES